MANTYKDVIITPNRSSNTNEPKIEFRGGNTTANTLIALYVYPDSNGTISFEGNVGQLFSITNDLSGIIFSVNDISGIPSIEVNANGQIDLAPTTGYVVVGNTTGVSSFTFTTTGTSAQEADYWLQSEYRSCEYYVSVKDNAANAYLSTKINVLHAGDTANVYYTEYGKIWSNTEIASFSANANTTHVRFWVTPTPSNTTLSIFRTNIAV